MDPIGIRLKEISEQADYLLRRVTDLAHENKDLKTRVRDLENRLRENSAEIQQNRERGETIQLAKSLSTSGSPEAAEELKKRLNRYIREIDQCLKLINE